MNPFVLLSPGILGLGLVAAFFILMTVLAMTGRKQAGRPESGSKLRDIPAFDRLSRSIGLAVEAGQRLHLSLGRGGLNGVQGTSALVGLSVLKRIARVTSVSDRPLVATSGDGALAILSQDTLQSTYRSIGNEAQYDPINGQLSGVTPFSYAVGTLPVLLDQQVSTNLLAGHFGSEVALITDTAERTGSLTLAGSDSLTAQAIMYAAAQEPLLGEEVYAIGAYVQAGPVHVASLYVQDIFRWLLVIAILAGVVLKLIGLL